MLPDFRGRPLLERVELVLIALMQVSLAGTLVWVTWRADWRNTFICAVALLITIVPAWLARRGRPALSVEFQLLLAVFIYGAAFLGSVANFYVRITWWDILLHGVAGMLCGYIGVMIVAAGHPKSIAAQRPFFAALFVASFALALGALWEIYEFTLDVVANQHMQMGPNDTMHDLVADAIGGLVVAAPLYISLRFPSRTFRLFESLRKTDHAR